MRRSHSIHGALLRMLGGGMVVVWLGMIGLLYVQIIHELDEWQERDLRQAGELLLAHLGDEASLPPHIAAPLHDQVALAFSVYDRQGRLLASSHQTALPLPPGDKLKWTVELAAGWWRCAVFRNAQRTLVVGHPQRLHHRLAREVAADVIMPVGAALALLLGLALLSLRRGLRPLRQLVAELQARQPDALQPLQTPLPAELAPVGQRLNVLFSQVGQLVQREQRFTSDAAHELRTPLAALRVQLEVATNSPRPEARAKALGQCTAGLLRLERLVTQLLALARLEHAPTNMEQVDFPQLCRQALAEAGMAGNVDVTRPWLWRGDPLLLALLVRNLIDNTQKYAGSGAAMSWQFDGPEVWVRDNGPGVDPAWLDRLGQRFVRPLGQAADGAGLGLSIVQRIVEVHGWRVFWQNHPAGGWMLQISAGPQVE